MMRQQRAGKNRSSLVDLGFKIQNQANRDALVWLPENDQWRDFFRQSARVGVGLSQLEAYHLAEKRQQRHVWQFRATQLGLVAKEATKASA